MSRQRPAWLLVVLAAVLPAVAAVCFALLGGVAGAAFWALFAAGAVALLLNVVVVLVAERDRRRQRAAELDAAARLRVAMKDALQPLAERIAAMPYGSVPGRAAVLRQVAVQAVGSLALLLRDVERVRAVVYALTEDGRSLQPLAYQGRASTPTPFEAGTPRGDLALQRVRSGGALHVADLATGAPEDWAGTGDGYRSLVAASIDNGEHAYGLLTVDAPAAGDLGEHDLHVVVLVADLLAVAFAEADVAGAGAADRLLAGEGAAARTAAQPAAGEGRGRVGSLAVSPPRPARGRDLTDAGVLAAIWDDARAAVRRERDPTGRGGSPDR